MADGGEGNNADRGFYGRKSLMENLGERFGESANGVVFEVVNEIIHETDAITNDKSGWKGFW